MIAGNPMTSVFEVRLRDGAFSRLEAVFDDEDLAREAAQKVEMRAQGGRVEVRPGGEAPEALSLLSPAAADQAATRGRTLTSFSLRGLVALAILLCGSIFPA